MIYSMTGFACKTLQLANTTIQLEIKSVNHRFLDLTIKLVEDFKALENLLREQISAHISRGKLDIRIFCKENQEANPQLGLNQALLNQYLKLIEQINQQGHDISRSSATDILALPGILTAERLSLDESQQPVLSAFSELIAEFKSSQLSEGEKLRLILKKRLTEIQSVIDTTQPLLKQLVANYRLKLKQRLCEALNELELNDNRLQQEFAFFCQKIDVTEEIDRLNAHVAEFGNLLNTGGQIGKRLDFMCQEMHREANTFGSKSVAIETSQKAVELKVLIEQIREQVQNIM